MLNSIFSQSPLFVIEKTLLEFETDTITFEQFLLSIEQQFSKVENWLERLENLNTGGCSTVTKVKQLGLEGTNKMMESLEIIHEAASEESFDEVEEELHNLMEGHRVVVESFGICEETQIKHAELISNSVGTYMI